MDLPFSRSLPPTRSLSLRRRQTRRVASLSSMRRSCSDKNRRCADNNKLLPMKWKFFSNNKLRASNKQRKFAKPRRRGSPRHARTNCVSLKAVRVWQLSRRPKQSASFSNRRPNRLSSVSARRWTKRPVLRERHWRTSIICGCRCSRSDIRLHWRSPPAKQSSRLPWRMLGKPNANENVSESENVSSNNWRPKSVSGRLSARRTTDCVRSLQRVLRCGHPRARSLLLLNLSGHVLGAQKSNARTPLQGCRRDPKRPSRNAGSNC